MIWREKEEAAKGSGSPSVVRQAQKGDLDVMTEIPVSYTHLDVYKRQP